MNKKKYLGIALVLFGIGLMLAFTMLWGCSSDSTRSTIVQGDLDDPAFAAIRDNLDDAIDSIVGKVHTPLTNPWDVPMDSSTWTDPETNWWSPLNPGDSADYDYSNDGWHVIYVYQLTASGSQIYYDSMAFYYEGRPVRDFMNAVDEMKYRGSYQREMDDGDQVTTLDYTTRVDFGDVNDLTVNSTGTAVVGVTKEYTEGSSDIVAQFDFDASFDYMQFTREDMYAWDNYTGVNGEVEIGLNYSVETTTGDNTQNTEQTWTITVTFEDDVAHVNATYGNTQWTYDHNL